MACPNEYSWDELLSTLTEMFAHDEVDTDQVIKVMSAYKNDKRDWEQFSMFEENRYTRNLVDRGNGKFNLLLMCWNKGQGSPIHDHSNSHCFMRILQGSVKETQYYWPDNENEAPVKEKCSTIHENGEVAYINDSIGLHRVENPSLTEGAVSLHLYSPPFQMCQTFDDDTGNKKTVQMAFHSEKGRRCISA